ncbi:RNase adapter RapZ [Oscillospiraceae bacterium OttesenSCG-928-G22]|nr:RNase adapter RapZ [Oscillospiraceae bacterium OttesenSCG-928-G22]
MEILIVSGLSGAGKSRAANILEDLGFYTVDNMPAALFRMFAEFCVRTGGRYERVALVTDIRGGETFDDLFSAIDSVRSIGGDVRILYLEADTDVIIRRYKETRRRHPLQRGDEPTDVVIERERSMLAPVRAAADHVVDTTELRESALKDRLISLFSGGRTAGEMLVTVLSFGFKYGIPVDCDLVFDLRFLPNPFYVEELRHKTGLSGDVRDYIFSFPEAEEFLIKLFPLLDFLLPHYAEEGKSTLTIGIGCTGGKHRSTAIARRVAEHIREFGRPANLVHRDIDK